MLTWRCAVLQPCYSWLEVPYYWAGLKAYDLVANFSNLAPSSYLSASESLRRFPTLAATRADGQSLKGTVRPPPPPLFPLIFSFLHRRMLWQALAAPFVDWNTSLAGLSRLVSTRGTCRGSSCRTRAIGASTAPTTKHPTSHGTRLPLLQFSVARRRTDGRRDSGAQADQSTVFGGSW